MKLLTVLTSFLALNAFADDEAYRVLEEKFHARTARAAVMSQFPAWDERRVSDLRCMFTSRAGVKRNVLITTLSKFIPGNGPLLPDRWERRLLVSNDGSYSEDYLVDLYFDSMWIEEGPLTLEAGMRFRGDF